MPVRLFLQAIIRTMKFDELLEHLKAQTEEYGKAELYVLNVTGGCTCCWNENDHIRGFYLTVDDALNNAIQILTADTPQEVPAGSQFASRGKYSVCRVIVELMKDNRIIINDEKVHHLVDIPLLIVDDDGVIDIEQSINYGDREVTFRGSDSNYDYSCHATIYSSKVAELAKEKTK